MGNIKTMDNIPKLRFREFNDEWKQTKLGDIATFSKGKGISKSDIADDGAFECIRYGELYTTYNEIINKIVSKTNSNHNMVYSKNNDILMPTSDVTPDGLATASALSKENIIIGGDIIIIRSLKIFNNFFSYYVVGHKKDIMRLVSGTTVFHLYAKEIQHLVLNLPQKQEQQKIADFLSCVDSKIMQLTQKQHSLQRYKKGVMQKIFSQEIRFTSDSGEEFGDWKVKRFENIADIDKGTQLNKDLLTKIGNYPAINGGINPSGFTSKWNTIANTISISEGGNSCGYIRLNKTKFWAGGHCYTIQNIKQQTNYKYLYQYLKYKELHIMRLRVGSGLPNIQKSEILNFKINLPPPNEQQKIADFLTCLDDKLALCQMKLDETKQFKKGLLQNMFT